MRGLHDCVVDAHGMLKSATGSVSGKELCKKDGGGEVAHAHRWPVEVQHWTRHVPSATLLANEEHLKFPTRAEACVGEMLHEDHLRTTCSHQMVGSLNHLFDAGEFCASYDSKLEHVWAEHVGDHRRMLSVMRLDALRNNASLLRMTHDWVANVESLRIRCSYSVHNMNHLSTLCFGSEIARQHCVALPKHSASFDARDQS
uniref:Uncharacterized protein n=1 Tax=Chrysotila carterae TaxID=13221 RepID=A0A7S4F9S3_CHRCT|mmetsp:Transcript_22025/g.48025  ORF Transcript_22025/g.48025 Transcript_22025/m.48025 type:complete len:201 (+) Transcript_22025:361-963(+)